MTQSRKLGPLRWDKDGKPVRKPSAGTANSGPDRQVVSKSKNDESGGARPGTGDGRSVAGGGTANSGPDRQEGASIRYPESGGARPGAHGTSPQEPPEGPSAWDAVGALVGGVGRGAKNAGKYLINEDAWADVLGPGDADWKDYANVALDASMLIPGAGVAGALARGGLKAAGKGMLASQGASLADRLLANKSTDTARRVALEALAARAETEGVAGAANKGFAAAIREGAKDAPLARGGLRSRAGGTFGDDYAKVFGKSSVRGDAAKKVGLETTQKGSVAARVNRSVGLAQTKRSTLAKGALTIGANKQEADITRRLRSSTRSIRNDPRNDGIGGQRASGGQPVYMIGGEPFPLAVTSGGNLEMPPSTQRAIAEFYKNGGSPDGTQVVYMGR